MAEVKTYIEEAIADKQEQLNTISQLEDIIDRALNEVLALKRKMDLYSTDHQFYLDYTQKELADLAQELYNKSRIVRRNKLELKRIKEQL